MMGKLYIMQSSSMSNVEGDRVHMQPQSVLIVVVLGNGHKESCYSSVLCTGKEEIPH